MALWSGTNGTQAAQKAVEGRRGINSLYRMSRNGMPAPPLTGRTTLGKLPRLWDSTPSSKMEVILYSQAVSRWIDMDHWIHLLKNRVARNSNYPHDFYFHTSF